MCYQPMQTRRESMAKGASKPSIATGATRIFIRQDPKQKRWQRARNQGMQLVLLLLAFLSAVYAQCTYVDGNTPCGIDFASYAVNAADYKTQQAFTTALNTKVANITDVMMQFDRTYGCSGAAIKQALEGMRYQVSMQCSGEMLAALNDCPPRDGKPPQGPGLCTDRCNLGVASMQAVFNNADACAASPSASIVTARTRLLAKWANVCRATTNETGKCTLGSTDERSSCGYRVSSAVELKDYCTKYAQKDDCCQRAIDKLQGNSSAPSLALIIGLVVAALVLILAVVVGVYFYRRRKANQSNGRGARLSDSYGITKQQPAAGNGAPNSKLYTSVSDGDHALHSQHSQLPSAADRQVDLQNSTRNVAPAVGTAAAATAAGVAGAAAITAANAQPAAPYTPPSSPPSTETDSKWTAKKQQQPQPPQPTPIVTTATATATPAQPTATATSPVHRPPMMIPLNMNALPAGAKRTRVVHPYEPSQSDELNLIVGNEIVLLRPFDDGWGLGYDPITYRQGAFPIVCVVSIDQDASGPASLYAPNDNDSGTDTTGSHRKRVSSCALAHELEELNKVLGEQEKHGIQKQ